MPRPLPDVAASRPVPRQGAIAELDAWHRLVICGRPEQVSVARAFIRQVLGVGHPGTERATLLTSELVTNSVNHSDSRLEGGTIKVTVRTAPGRVRVEVQDDGGSTAPTLRSDDDLAEAGRGLRLVEAYSLVWDYHQIGTRMVTWFECVSEPLPLGSVRHKKGFNGLPRSGPAPTGCERRRHGPHGGRCARRNNRAGPG
jgi:anti-sigma regulatory factor (Ser/Thr protein kinase)